MPKMALLVLFSFFFTGYLSAQETRKPRWPLPKLSRGLSSFNEFRLAEYQGYLKSLTPTEQKEFAEDARINLGSLGVNPERIIIKFKDAETEQLVLQALSFKKPLRDFQTVGAKVIQIPKAKDHTELFAHLGALKELEGVDYVSPDYKIRIAAVPNDPQYPRQWHYHNTGINQPVPLANGLEDADIDAPEAWEVSTGSRSVVVGVIDTGIEYTHPDLVDNIWSNPGETGTDSSGNDKSTNGVDDDENGYIDDFRGWDFVANDNDPLDDNGHGTHVAGTIGASGNNGVGVPGINWQVSLVPLQIFDSSGQGDFSTAMAALDYATKMKFPITNNSYGGNETVSAFEDLLKENRDAGGLFIAAAGNSAANNDTTSFYPANSKIENVISVAATDHKDQLAYFSNYGKNSVHLAAPGDPVLSTEWGMYLWEAGTSMAAPHVTGAAALIKSVWPNLTYSEIKNKILESVDVIYHPNFVGKLITDGRLNVARAVGGVPSPLPYRLLLQSVVQKVGPLSGGTRLTLKGVGFHPDIKVSIGMKPCQSIQVVSQMELSCTTSASAIAGLHNVIATNPDGKTSTLSGAFRYQNPPTLTSLSATAGPLAGGNRITVLGTLFGTGTKIKVGEKDCAQVQVSSASQLSCVLPASAAGTYPVKAINQYGQESSESISYTYRPAPQVGSISPAKGLLSGGGLLNVSGSNFVAGATIKLGTQVCSNPQRLSATQMTCAIPALPAGSHPVQVTNPEGQSSNTTKVYEAVSPRWVQTNGGSCSTVCSGLALISKASPEGAYCASGEVVPSSARGVINFSNGCKPNRNCVTQGPVNGASSQGRFCYGPGQTKNNERTDVTIGCYCSL